MAIRSLSSYTPISSPITEVVVPNDAPNPYIYKNISNGYQQIIVGESVGKVEISDDGERFFDVGVTSGTFLIRPNDYIAFTYDKNNSIRFLVHLL